MDKGEKDDPGSPTRNNLFENAAANLLGVYPFGLPYAAHLAHIPGAFLMGHPAFPVTSLFDGLMGHYPSSLVTSSASAYHSLYSSASMRSPQQKSSPKTVSHKNTITKATTTIATTTTSSCSNSISRKTVTTPVVAGSTGVSLLSGKVKKSTGRPPKTDSSTKTNGSSVSSSHSSSRTSTVSQPVKSPLNLSTNKQKENGVVDNDCQSDISSCSSYLSDDGSNVKVEDKSKNAGSTIHIDGLKKKLIADQIRQRVQSKPTQSTTPSILQPMKRGRGRPPKSNSKEGIALEEIQEELKKQFEANLKEQQIQLKMFKKAQELKDMETSAKINQLLEAHANLGKPLSSEQVESQSTSGTFKPKSKSLQASIDKLKAASKLPSSDNNGASQTVKPRLSSPTGRQTMTSPSHKQQSSHKTKSGSQSHNHISKLGSPTRKRVDSPTNLSMDIGSPSHKHSDAAMSPPVPSPTERSKLFAESLFNKIRTEVEQDNKSDENIFTRIRTESEQNTTCDEDDSSDSDRSQAIEYDSEDRNEESDTSNLAMKRSADEMSEDYDGSSSTSKRPRVQTDERELKVPLERGWKRSTTILAIGKRGFIGEVLYFAPCGKKMKTIPDVMRYIDKHVITNLGRENFSFCTRVNVGEFYEQRGEENEIVKLSQAEIVQRMTLIESKRQKLRKLKEQRGRKKSEKQNKQILLAKQMMEQKFKKKVEQQALEKRKQQEQLRLLKEQEKLQRHEQMRMERELRAQQILETNLLWYHMERDREMKRQQALLMKEQVNTDRERRRQHILLVKALETQKKQAEKDRIKESRMAEKKISRERKMEQRRQELQLLRELRRPVDDMQLKEARVLPEYPRIKGIELNGTAFADILMVLEFLHNFSDALGFVDSDTLPTLRTLQEAVIGKNEEDMEDYIALTSHLTRYAVMDPGVPNPKEAVTKLGQKIIDVDISDGVVSEVLCIFITARNGKPNEMSDWLQEKPLESLHQNQRASILAFLCNELLCGKSISSEIEKNLDHMGDIRRDKWVIEGQLRRLRVKQGKKFRSPTKPVREDDNSVLTKDGDDSILTCQDGDESTCMSVSKRGSDEEEEKDDESGNEYDENQSVKDNEEEVEDENLSFEECEKKIEKLQKQHAQHRAKVFKASHRVRAITLGQDRYKRRYWVLPKAGGVYVEGLESGHFEETNMKQECEIKSESTSMAVEDTKANIKDIKEENELSSAKLLKLKSSENSSLGSSEVSDNVNIKQESSDFSGKKDNEAENTNSDVEMKSCNGEISTSADNSAISLQTESKNIFLQSPTSNKLSDLCNLSTVKSERSEDSNLIIPHAHSSPLITPYSPSPFNMFFNSFSNQTTESNASPLPAHQHPKSSTPSTDSKSSFLSIDTLLKKENEPVKTSSSSSIFSTFSLAQITSNDDQKPWFSILPRMPCEDLSVAQVTSQLGMHGSYNSLPFFSPLTVSAFPIQSPAFSSFQIGQLTNSNQDEGEIKQNLNISETNNSFKIPNTPKMEPNTPSFFDPGEINTYDEPQPIEKEMTEGWWRVIDQNQVKELMRCCHPRGIREKNLQKTLQKFQEYACESCSKGDKHIVSLEASDSSDSEEENKETNEDKIDKKEDNNEDEKQEKRKKKKRKESEESVIDHAHQVELTVLDAVENLEERVASASLQVKGWKVPQRISDESDIKLVDRFHENLKENEKYPLDVAREKLINLEPNIERRYLKPPLCKNQQINMANISASSFNDGHDSNHCDENGDEDEEEQPSTPAPVPSGLLTWRNAVALSKSPAQLTLCVYQLNNAISWEKSIMKVLCQICRKDDNEAELLLCDGCDKGYHTYCFKPKMDNIPDGDWYCYACISKATGEPCCIVCGRKNGKIIECDHCPRAIHIDCLDPPLPRMPRKYACPSCIANQGMKKKQKRSPKKRRESFVRRERKDSETSTKTVEIPVEKKRGKNVEKLRTAEQSDNMTACRLVLTEMEKHEDGWPFLKPVNFKQFPTYKKYIKNPMDFTTMKNKLRDSLYKTRGDFASDTRLVFNNCMIFNEDESDVGKAGHTMRKYFEQRWKDLLLSSDSTEQPSVGEDENS